ncbi:acyl-CoA dehydrogenase family protein [Marinobacter shengliensis]|uniref:acyl-CoA dehydrogenase family protein n=1 Tax=Marinobacter shengliensis TaxID=1389223 RepID=UPI001E510D67|nr:acyl-CoA dehydrogenase family protein [Marinobacter shengliensis]
MTRDPIGLALSIMNRISGNPLLDRLGLRSPLERTAYQGTRTGFRTIALAGREFKRVRNWLPRKRLPPGAPGDLFDLSLDDDQQMIVDSLKRLARDVLRPAAQEADEQGRLPEAVKHEAAV